MRNVSLRYSASKPLNETLAFASGKRGVSYTKLLLWDFNNKRHAKVAEVALLLYTYG